MAAGSICRTAVATNISALRADLIDHHQGPTLMVSRMRGPGNPKGKTTRGVARQATSELVWVLCEGQPTTCPPCKLGLVRAAAHSSLRGKLLLSYSGHGR